MNAAGLVRKWRARYKESILLKRLLAVLSVDILVKLSGILLLPVFLRLMTQDEYGLYNYLLSIILTLAVVLNFGLYIPLSKFYHDDTDPAKRGELLFTISALLISILTLLLVPVYLFHWDYTVIHFLFKNKIDYGSYRMGVLLALVMTVLNFMLTNYFYATEKIRKLQQYNIARILTINIASVTALFLLKGTSTVQVRLLTTYLAELLLFLIFSIFFIKESGRRFNRGLVRPGLKLALPIMVSAMFGIVINFSDKFFLEKNRDFTDLSYYYLAASCASVIPLIFTSFQNAWLPLFLKEKDLRRNVARTNKLLLRIFAVFTILSLLIVLFVKIVLVLGIIQQKYEQTLYILPIMLISQTFSAMVPLYTNYLIYFEKTYITSVTGLLLCMVSLGLSMLLIPPFGVYGAATVSLLSNLTYLCVYYFIIRSYTKKLLTSEIPGE
ncbi:MAG TPA: oligosaccharide flippase family protein [Puia sp.]|nr:oligosaccharide flippase family protein [Puia sp.]